MMRDIYSKRTDRHINRHLPTHPVVELSQILKKRKLHSTNNISPYNIINTRSDLIHAVNVNTLKLIVCSSYIHIIYIYMYSRYSE